MAGRVVGAGYHDLHFRWDVSMPQRVVGRLGELDYIGPWPDPGRTVWASRDRFGKWHHLLGSRHALVGYVVGRGKQEIIRRLEVQAHLGPEGEDDLLPASGFAFAWEGLQRRMGLYGVLPVGDPVVTRIDAAVDVEYEDPGEGFVVLEALKNARWPYGWYAEYQGPPPYTTVAVKSGRRTIARVYCRNSKLRTGGARWGKLRFEREQVFQWARAPFTPDHLSHPVTPQIVWESVFGSNQGGVARVSGRVQRVPREVQTMKLVDRVRLGEIGYSQFERMAAFLDAERLGVAEVVYSPDTLRRRRREARELGLSVADVESEVPEFEADIDELLSPVRSAWAA